MRKAPPVKFKERAGGIRIGKMAFFAHYAFFQVPWITAVDEHPLIVIGFEYHYI